MFKWTEDAIEVVGVYEPGEDNSGAPTSGSPSR